MPTLNGLLNNTVGIAAAALRVEGQIENLEIVWARLLHSRTRDAQLLVFYHGFLLVHDAVERIGADFVASLVESDRHLVRTDYKGIGIRYGSHKLRLVSVFFEQHDFMSRFLCYFLYPVHGHCGERFLCCY